MDKRYVLIFRVRFDFIFIGKEFVTIYLTAGEAMRTMQIQYYRYQHKFSGTDFIHSFVCANDSCSGRTLIRADSVPQLPPQVDNVVEVSIFQIETLVTACICFS